MKESKWHWIRHNWGKWTPYEQPYGCFSGRTSRINPHYRTEIREWRRCKVCGHLQDKKVVHDGTLQVITPPESTQSRL